MTRLRRDGIIFILNDASQITQVINNSTHAIHKSEEIKKHNTENGIDKSVLINGRNLTNFGVFRKYLQTYIESHSAINKEMTLMVRQLAPTSQGIPMEIYAFSSDIRWQNYEYVMGDIFDHVLASVQFFDLEIYELTVANSD